MPAAQDVYDVNIGDLKNQIILQYPTRVPDGEGPWVNAATVWAMIDTLRSDRATLAMQDTGTAIHNITIHYRTDINTSWRIKYGDKYWALLGPPIDIKKEHLWLLIKVKEVSV